MEPIISPWFIYALGVIDTVGAAAGIFTGVLGIISLGWIGMTAGIRSDGNITREQAIRSYKYSSIAVIMFILTLAVSILTPTSKTLMAMYAASVATPDNFSAVVGAGKSFKDEVKQDIIDLMENGLNKPKDKDLAE